MDAATLQKKINASVPQFLSANAQYLAGARKDKDCAKAIAAMEKVTSEGTAKLSLTELADMAAFAKEAGDALPHAAKARFNTDILPDLKALATISSPPLEPLLAAFWIKYGPVIKELDRSMVDFAGGVSGGSIGGEPIEIDKTRKHNPLNKHAKDGDGINATTKIGYIGSLFRKIEEKEKKDSDAYSVSARKLENTFNGPATLIEKYYLQDLPKQMEMFLQEFAEPYTHETLIELAPTLREAIDEYRQNIQPIVNLKVTLQEVGTPS